MTLDEYLSNAGIRRSHFADSIGVSAVTITLLCQGKRLPSYDLLSRIADATDGKVGLGDFEPAKRDSAA